MTGKNAVVNLCYRLFYFNIFYLFMCLKFSHFIVQLCFVYFC